jgi:hypothetical protein
MHGRIRRSHAPKPKLGEICTVSWRGREPSKTRKPSPRRRLRRTPNASTRIFGHSSGRSNRRDAEREASCTSMASSVSDLPTAVGLPHNQPRTALSKRKLERQGRDVLPVDSSCSLVGPTPPCSLVFWALVFPHCSYVRKVLVFQSSAHPALAESWMEEGVRFVGIADARVLPSGPASEQRGPTRNTNSA